jgi:RimJ/RimL family protein N-acetyltransferase
MAITDLDEMTAVLGGPDPARPPRRQRTREDAERWIAWNIANYAEQGFGLWIVETHEGEVVGDCGLTIQEVVASRRHEGRADVAAHRVQERRGRPDLRSGPVSIPTVADLGPCRPPSLVATLGP